MTLQHLEPEVTQVFPDPDINGVVEPPPHNVHNIRSQAQWRFDDDLKARLLMDSPDEFELANRRGNITNRCLYLWGEPGYGKTHAIEALLPGISSLSFAPDLSSNFLLNGFDEDEHYAVYLPDAPDWPEWLGRHRMMFYKLPDSRVVAADQKHGDQRKIMFRGLLIVVCNFQPPTDNDVKGCERRFTFIHADTPWQRCVAPAQPLPPIVPPAPPVPILQQQQQQSP